MLRGIFAGLGMLVLILDGRTALLGAAEGIELCLKTVIPALFPFFVLSHLLCSALVGRPIPMLRSLGTWCGIPAGAESLLAIGFLGGYPVGAKTVADSWKSGQLSRQDARRMLGLCNNPGPSFLFGILGPLFPLPWIPWMIWAVMIVSALTVGIWNREPPEQEAALLSHPVSLPEALTHGLHVTASVCGWVLLFRMVLAFAQRWFLWLAPKPLAVLLSGLLELSNGCLALSQVENTGLRLILACTMLSCGGLCVAMQTVSVSRGLCGKQYWQDKLLQTALALWLSGAAQLALPAGERFFTPDVLFFFLPIPLIFLRYRKNKSGNAAAFRV